MLEVAVTLYDCVSSHFPPCVSYSCAVRCNTHLPLLQQFFRTPLAGKRRDTYRSIFLVRVFLLFLFSDPLLALQQRSSEVQEGRHLVLHQMQHFLSRPRPRASRLLLLNLPYRLRCVNNKFSSIQVHSNYIFATDGTFRVHVGHPLASDLHALYPDVPTPH